MFFDLGCTVSLKALVRFKNCRVSSFWKGAVNSVAKGVACLTALIDVLPSWETSVLLLWNEPLC